MFFHELVHFVKSSFTLIIKGSNVYKAWVAFLLLLIGCGVAAYFLQFREGLIVTSMRDQVMWGFYIGNFTFLVGIAAAAVVLVIPAYIYNWGPIKEIVLIGELLAISAIVMCMLFVTVDLGHPERVWHLIPLIGALNLGSSVLSWDVLVLNLYLILNVVIASHIIYRSFVGKTPIKSLIIPLVILSIPSAVSIHTVTAFIYNGLPARPYWNASILAPRFLASAFCSGPAIILFVLQILKKTWGLNIKEEAIWKIAELMAYSMALNLFFLISELFKEFYSSSYHLLHTRYFFFGVEGHNSLVVYAWSSIVLSFVAFLLFLIPATRKNVFTLNLGCLFIYIGVYIEKGLGLVLPGLTPDTLGEIYEYVPSIYEIMIAAGIFSTGFLIFTLLVKIAIPIALGKIAYKPKTLEVG